MAMSLAQRNRGAAVAYVRRERTAEEIAAEQAELARLYKVRIGAYLGRVEESGASDTGRRTKQRVRALEYGAKLAEIEGKPVPTNVAQLAELIA